MLLTKSGEHMLASSKSDVFSLFDVVESFGPPFFGVR